MGPDKKYNLKKCGEILIDMEKELKRKVYTFSCAFCDNSCDQLKKFTIHLEQKHFQPITDDIGANEGPETKLEILIEDQTDNDSNDKGSEENCEATVHDTINEDPLGTKENIKTTVEEFPDSIEVENVDYNEQYIEIEFIDEVMDYDEGVAETEQKEQIIQQTKEKIRSYKNKDVVDYEENDEDDKEKFQSTKKGDKKVNQPKRKSIRSNVASFEDPNVKSSEEKTRSYRNEDVDYEICSEESDEDYEEKFQSMKKGVKKVNQPKKKNIRSNDSSIEDPNVESSEKNNNTIKKKRIRKRKSELDKNVDEKEFIIALFEAYEKQPILWIPKERTSDKATLEKCFEVIAKEVNDKLNASISGKYAQIRINAMRFECSYEVEKQRKGEDYQFPWYYEHMKYLEENIDYMIKLRYNKFRSRLKNLDTSLLPPLIELYKNHNDLWQVDSINFCITAKRDDAFNKIIEDLKTLHNIDMTTDLLQDYIRYINRIYSNDKEQALKCELENKVFRPTSQYYDDLLFLNESQGPFKCDTCNEIIQKYGNYHVHVAEHNNTKAFKCPLCGMGFKRFGIYLLHARRHLKINSFHCDICGKDYPFKFEYEQHLTAHSGEKPFLCQICGTRFRSSGDYDNHIRRHEKRFRYECHICKHGFNHLHTLKDHVKSHLQIRDIFCNVCGKSFTAQRYLNNHKLIHEDTKRYKCHVCGKEFSQGASYRTHRKLHQPHLTAAELKRKKESEQELKLDDL